MLTLPRIYQLEKSINRAETGDDAEHAPLIRSSDDPDQVFQRALDVELEKVSSFYEIKEREIYGEVEDLLREKAAFEAETDGQGENGRLDMGSRMGDHPRRTSLFRNFTRPRRASTISQALDGGADDSDDEDDESTALQRSRLSFTDRSKSTPHDANGGGDGAVETSEPSKSIRRHSLAYDDYAHDELAIFYSSGITLKKRATSIYVQLCELKSFAQLNKTGFSKVLKKYDKICNRNLKQRYIEKFVAPAYPFSSETMNRLDENIHRMEQAYADVVTQGDVAVAKKELRLHLREHVVWERNTVWREMIGIERKAEAATMGLRRTLLGADNDPTKARLQGDDDNEPDMKELQTPVGRVACPTWLLSSTMLTLVIIITVFFVLLYIPIFDKPEEQNCLAMLVFVSLLWATEVSGLAHIGNVSLTLLGHTPIRHISHDTLSLRSLAGGAV